MTAAQPRIPKLAAGGAGGQYTFKTQTPHGITLSADGVTEAQFAQRQAALAAAGYVPAKQPNTFALASPVPDAGYPQLPVVDGGRRTHRATYRGQDISVQMPSAAAVKRYSYNHGGTFEFPVAGSFPGGQITGTVRVTQNGANEWSVQGLGFPPGSAELIAEAVGAVLEARRPRLAIEDARQLAQRRAERFAAAGGKVEEPREESSFITAAGYDRGRGVLAIRIREKLYGYRVTEQQARAFFSASSVGSAYNRLVRGGHRVDVRECPACHRFNVGESVHRCPSRHLPPPATTRLRDRLATV
ncbi:KTSC domain-containing protein [Agromyces humi]|uniref:KTSC domain-containing protein n=1 Tax=Agromyces humi TaxID=1766800 RepID=UPI00135A817A|nr:KTSC domain-containing protein [Agromyces humi]